MLGVHIEGDLCPVCRYKLIQEYAGKYEEFPVSTIEFSKRARVGIGVVPPVDPNNQDTSVLIGSEDISKLDLYSEGDPRVLELNGALNIGNRGVVEFIEVFKNEIEYLHCMITATQEKVVPAPGRHGLVYVDTVIVAHSNEAEWQKFKADHTNEAILDRIVVVRVPKNHPQLRLPGPCRATYVGSGFHVCDPVPLGADQQVRSHDQAQAL
jgi:serine protein kinase